MSAPELPGYSELEKVGQGGFAIVYRAMDDANDRPVAIKVMNRFDISEDLGERFRREGLVVGLLGWHPNILTFYTTGRDGDGRPFMVSDFVSGGSLMDRVIARSKLPWVEAVGYIVGIADALAAAHAKQVLHRDIKPENILFDDRLGDALLTDFGIASIADSALTGTGETPWTAEYVAPEILKGAPATELSDIYQLAATLHTLIAGEPPYGFFEHNIRWEGLQRISSDDVPLPLAERQDLDLPAGLSEIVAKGLSNDPTQRWESAALFGRELRELQHRSGEPPTAMKYVDQKLGTFRPGPPAALAAGNQVASPNDAPRTLPGVGTDDETIRSEIEPKSLPEFDDDDQTVVENVIAHRALDKSSTSRAQPIAASVSTVQRSTQAASAIAIEGFTDFNLIGVGGFSRVYSARQSELNRDVALKVLNGALDSVEERVAFERECQAMGAVSAHPHIVTLHRATYNGTGAPVLVMEHYGGGTLRQLIADDALSTPAILDYGVKLASGLGAAHSAGILHRDVKPQNIFISNYGQPALGDFGISTFANDREESVGVTLHYAAPEVLQGRPSGEQSDVYSLAATLYTALAGRRPFESDVAQSPGELARRIAIEEPSSLAKMGASRAVDEVIRTRGLAKDPAQRYASVTEFGEAMRQVQVQMDLPKTAWVTSGQTRVDSSPEHVTDDTSATIVQVEKARSPEPRAPVPVSRRATFAGLLAIVLLAGVIYLGSRGITSEEPGAQPTVVATTQVVGLPLSPLKPTDVEVIVEDDMVVVRWTNREHGLPVEIKVLDSDIPMIEVPAGVDTYSIGPVSEIVSPCVQLTVVGENGQVSRETSPKCLGGQ